MEIDFEKMSAVVERLEREISKGACRASVTIGARESGNVFRLEVFSRQDAEDEGVTELRDWSWCLVPDAVIHLQQPDQDPNPKADPPPRVGDYETWRVSFQSGEQATQALWDELQRVRLICMRAKESLYSGDADDLETADLLEGVFRQS